MGIGSYFVQCLPYILALVLGLVAALYLYLSHKLNYWKKRGIPYAEPSLIFGNIKDSAMQVKDFSTSFKEAYDELDGHKFGGIYFFQRPMYLIRDPDLIKAMFVKDFSHFVDHDTFIDEEVDPLQAKGLFVLQGQRWRKMRIKLTPTFTSGKMKKMFHLVCDCAEELDRYIQGAVDKGEAIEVRDLLARFTTDVIATCAFGINVNSIQNPQEKFREMGRKLTSPLSLLDSIKIFLLLSFPNFSKTFRVAFTNQDVVDFFRKVVKDTLDQREKSRIVRNDFVDLLLKLKKLGKVDDDDEDNSEKNGLQSSEDGDLELSDDDITAQVLLFFVGGFETSSTLLNFALYELALNRELQTRLQEEIDKALENADGILSYQSVMHDMELLDRVVSEVLRKYPPLPVTDRVCTQPYIIPDTDVTMEKGQVVQIPIHAMHHDPRFYPDPEKFDPDRFTEENKKKRHPYVYIPFGEGPRMCIGMRFAQMQSKVCLVSLLSKYDVNTSEKTRIPFEFDPKSFFPAGKGGTWLKFTRRSDR